MQVIAIWVAHDGLKKITAPLIADLWRTVYLRRSCQYIAISLIVKDFTTDLYTRQF